MAKSADTMLVRDFLQLVQENPGAFPREAVAKRGRLGLRTVFHLVHAAKRNPQQRGVVDPKLSTLEKFLHGCGARLIVVLPDSTAKETPQ